MRIIPLKDDLIIKDGKLNKRFIYKGSFFYIDDHTKYVLTRVFVTKIESWSTKMLVNN